MPLSIRYAMVVFQLPSMWVIIYTILLVLLSFSHKKTC